MFNYDGNGWRVARSIETFGNQIMELRGNTNSYPTDGTIGDVAHSNRLSDHNPGPDGLVRAIDFHESSRGFVDEVAEHVRRSRDTRLKYFIHDDRMFSSYGTDVRDPWDWGEYTGVNGHETHGHLSVLATTAADRLLPEWAVAPTTPVEGEDMSLPITPASSRDDIRLLQIRLNGGFKAGLSLTGTFDTPTIAAVKTHLLGFTGADPADPEVTAGKEVNAAMKDGLDIAHFKAKLGSISAIGVSEAKVKQLINASKNVIA